VFSRWVLRSRHSHSVLLYVRCVFPTRTLYGLSGLAVLSLVITGLLARITPQSPPTALATLVPVYILVHLLRTRLPTVNFRPTFGRVWGSVTCATVLHPRDRVCTRSLQGLFWVATSRSYYCTGKFRFKPSVLSGLSPNSPSSCFLVRDPPSKTAKVARSLRIEYLDLKESRTRAKGSPD
jgi:hypothetical protein